MLIPNVIQLQIIDTGIGIAVEHQSNLFKPFSQADNSTTRKFGGTGLGLMLSKRLAEALGGRFFLASSVLGRGSVFELRLPLTTGVNVSAPVPPKANVAKGSTRIDGARVLLIEDSDDNRHLFESVLRSEGAFVKTAKNGKEGVDLASHDTFDIVITDIQMPVMDGYEAASTLRKKGFHNPILGLTAHAFREDRDRSKANGIDEHLTKPIDAETLVERVSFYLDRGRKFENHSMEAQ